MSTEDNRQNSIRGLCFLASKPSRNRSTHPGELDARRESSKAPQGRHAVARGTAPGPRFLPEIQPGKGVRSILPFQGLGGEWARFQGRCPWLLNLAPAGLLAHPDNSDFACPQEHMPLMATKEKLIPWRHLLSLMIPIVLALSAGCRTSTPSSDTTQARKLRLSMIPTTDPGRIVRESQPLVTYLEKETNVKVELTVPTNYAAVVEAIANDQVDIAYLGGFTYVQASQRAGVIPLVQRERDQNFHSLFITQPDSGINSLADLQGKRFAFGDVNSTSGHLMPQYFMRQANVDQEVIAKAIYTGGHDATALAVANRKVDAGALDETVFEKMVNEGKLDASKVKVFFKTPPFFDYVWAARKNLDPKLADSFASAFMRLSADDPSQKSILDQLNATRYVKANDADYEKLRQAAREAGLLK